MDVCISFLNSNWNKKRDLVQRTYVPPQVPDDLSVELLAEQYASDYRRLYIEYPRVRLDGVYIAVCHYVYVYFINLD